MDIDYDFFRVDEAYSRPQKGKILISEPFLNDSYFRRSIVFLTEHSAEGAVGFVLNKPVNLAISEVIKDFPNIDTQISIGGPVQTNTLHYIHTLGDIIPESIPVVDEIYWGGDFETIKELASLDLLKTKQIKFFLGYSGWAAQQLETEIERDSWVITDIEPERVMAEKNDHFWKEMLNRLGEKYRLWSTFPENPTMN